MQTLFAVEFVIKRKLTTDGETQTLTQTVSVRKTYLQEWPVYNAAQTQEKERFQRLLYELCQGIGGPSQKTGRPRLPLLGQERLFSKAEPD